MAFMNPNLDIELVLYADTLDPPTPPVARALGVLDVEKLLRPDGKDETDRAQFTAHLARAVAGPQDTVGAAMFAAIERYVAGDASRGSALAAMITSEFADNCFAMLMDSRATDFDRFNAMLSRVLALSGTGSNRKDSVGGLPPADYWAHLLNACRGGFDDDDNSVPLSDLDPNLWVAVARYALHSGVTAETAETAVNDTVLNGSEEAFPVEVGFRDAILSCAGPGCASIFDSLVAERSMAARISISSPGSDSSAETSARRRAPI